MQEHFNFPLHISFCQQWFLATASNCYLIKWSTIGPKKRVQIAHWSPSYPRSVGLIKSYSCRLVEGWMPASDATRLPASSDLSRPADLSSRTVLLLLLRCLFACTIASALMSAGSQAMALHGCWRLCASNSWSRWPHQKFRIEMAVLEICSTPLRGHEQGSVLSLSEQMHYFKQLITSRGGLV